MESVLSILWGIWGGIARDQTSTILGMRTIFPVLFGIDKFTVL